MSAQVIVCCGSGGVGKTTTSAALALHWAGAGDRVCVLTVDPARRLADSLNIGRIGGQPTRVPLNHPDGYCDAVMLDVEETFERLIRRFSSSHESAEKILANRYFQFASTRLGGVHEYMAAERVRELATSGEYDVVIVDTPPTRNALDFLQAPERMAELMDGAVMRWMSMPSTKGGWRALELGSEAVTRVLQLLIGENTIGEIAQFFDLFRDLWEGFHARSLEVQAMLRSASTRFLLITSPSPAARNEALFFLDQLRKQRMPFGGFLVNRVEVRIAGNLENLPSDGPIGWADAVSLLKRLHSTQNDLAAVHERSIQALVDAGPSRAPVWRVPHQGQAVNHISDLLALGHHLPKRDDLL